MLKELYQKLLGLNRLDVIIQNQNEEQKKWQNFNKTIKNATKMLFVAKAEIKDLTKQLEEKNAVIRQVEKKYETIIDKQYSELQKLRTQLEHATQNRKGKFYVFNPQHGMPRKIYDSYVAAQNDAESVAKISNGQKVFVLKIVSGVQIDKNFEDYAIMPEEDVPF